MEDASLAEFTAGDSPGASGSDERADSEAADSTDTDSADTDSEGAPVTYAWSPDGAACAACGTDTSVRWGDGAGLVCADCKDW